jgi:putative drug exporter of the RND superfamily
MSEGLIEAGHRLADRILVEERRSTLVKIDESFYVPPEVFDNAEFQRGLKLFLSPDGRAARMIITHASDPATPEGISHIDVIRHSAQEAVKGTPLAGSNIYIGRCR